MDEATPAPLKRQAQDFWRGDFGNEYTHRNRVNWTARIPFWKHIINHTNARSVFELGCNAGWNLSAIRRAFPDVATYGSDINRKALKQATAAGLEVGDGPGPDASFELVFTAGVLIHIPPDAIMRTMQDLVNLSDRWVLAVEYSAETEEAIDYRGHANRLWRRPYGDLYRGLGLRLINQAPAEGFDRCHYWLMEKP